MRILRLDIETAPAKAYIWGLKTRYIPLNQVAEEGYVLTFSYSWEGEDWTECWTLWDDGYDAMIQKAWHLLDEADAVIHYNGSSFDIPTLNTEFLVAGLGPPSPYEQIDLYRVVRSNFRTLSKSMNHMLKLLSLEEKIDHKGMPLWTGCMEGDKECQKEMVAYNIQDVEVLEDLYKELLPWIKNHPNRGLWMTPGTELICPNCGGTHLRFKGYKRTRVLTYKQYHCQNCGSYPRSRYAEDSGKNRRQDILT